MDSGYAKPTVPGQVARSGHAAQRSPREDHYELTDHLAYAFDVPGPD